MKKNQLYNISRMLQVDQERIIRFYQLCLIQTSTVMSNFGQDSSLTSRHAVKVR